MEDRYTRNINSLTFIENKKLREFKVCVIGCGGLGGYIIEMLARIGIGHITVVDGDVFDETNLNRQILCIENNIGRSKVKAAKKRVSRINSKVVVETYEENLTYINGENIINEHSLVIDAVDNIETKLTIQELCKLKKIPLVHGAISGWYGQVCVIYPGDDTLNYLYKDKRVDNSLGNPSFTPANIAAIQVSEGIKVLLNKGEILRGKVLLIDLLYNEYNLIELNK